MLALPANRAQHTIVIYLNRTCFQRFERYTLLDGLTSSGGVPLHDLVQMNDPNHEKYAYSDAVYEDESWVLVNHDLLFPVEKRLFL
ncbi:MAG: hypothetical protein H0V70_30345 [Ktedonobacteraceae bacterium]|nr:hypothetical protein [Ktedonobacteraceae bacterium]